MAIYHFRLGVVQRAKGQSVVAVAADRARARLHDDRLDLTFGALPAKRGSTPALSEVLLPDGAPPDWRDRETLWNAVEVRENRRDAALAREVEFALPAELDLEQGAELARDYVQASFVADGMVADLNVHGAVRDDGQPKPYAQTLLTMRRCGPEGFAPSKEREWNQWSNALRWRQLWSEMANARLAVHGHAVRIDHRSHAERRIHLEPQNETGPHVARRGEPSERVEEHRDIARRNEERAARDVA